MKKRHMYLGIVMVCVMVSCSTSKKNISNKYETEKTGLHQSLFSDAVSGVDLKEYHYSETFEKNWYSYDVRFDRGFNPFIVPFKYRCESGKPDNMQRLTFPTLLSLKFDFVENNICTRHPGFIYQRDQEVTKLTIEDRVKVLEAMDAWGQNVAIGGSVVQNGKMYSGTLKIINHDKVLLERRFGESGYFELMGKMVKAWMQISGSPPSKLLEAELMRPMTSSRDAIRTLGESFKVEQSCQAQWDIYERILKLDPDFAEVRWWYALQKWWQTQDHEWKASMTLAALESHLVVPALPPFKCLSSESCIRRFETIRSRFKKIAPNHWVVLALSCKNLKEKMSKSNVEKWADMAIARPYAYCFSSNVADNFWNYDNYNVSIPLQLSIINSGYNPGNGILSEYKDLVFSFVSLGYLRDASALLRPMFEFTEDKSVSALYAGYVMNEAMAFNNAIDLFKLALESKDEHDKKLAVEYLINAYLDAGLISKARGMITSEYWNVVSDRLKPVFEGRILYAEGDREAASDKLLTAKAKINNNDYDRRFLEKGLFEIQSEQQSEALINTLDRLWSSDPRSRMTYHLYKKVHHNNKEKMQAYLNVTAYLFPNQAYWQNEAKVYSTVTAPDEKLLEDKLSEYEMVAESGGLEKLSGFELENVCLSLLRLNRDKYYKRVEGLYLAHARNHSQKAHRQVVHRFTFYSSMESWGK